MTRIASLARRAVFTWRVVGFVVLVSSVACSLPGVCQYRRGMAPDHSWRRNRHAVEYNTR
jgi:hypothetical protein